MAEALVPTIPCERCNAQINLDDWTEHIVSNRYFINEYFNLYLTYYREHVLIMETIKLEEKKGKEIIYNLLNRFLVFRISIDDESDIERIPCEFCDALINLDDWRSHTVNRRYVIHSILYFKYIFRKYVVMHINVESKNYEGTEIFYKYVAYSAYLDVLKMNQLMYLFLVKSAMFQPACMNWNCIR